jgi:hypothetical protein
LSRSPASNEEDPNYFYYFERTETCTKHIGVKVTFQVSKYGKCPLCVALEKSVEHETVD